MEPVIILSAYYGLRRSEAIGLKWSDIDFDNDTVYINRSRVNLDHGRVADKSNKNQSSHRALPLIPTVKIYLLNLREKQNSNENYKSDYVCQMETGYPINPDYVSKKFKALIRSLDMPDDYRFHDLRHSVASYLLKNHLSMKQVQYWMGHADIGTSMDIYAHLDSEMKQESADVLNKLLD
jgi:integrase